MFDFLKYIKPFWYYRLIPKIPIPILLTNVKLDELVSNSKISVGEYRFNISLYMDLAYQALIIGYLPESEDEISDLQKHKITDISENYRFVFRQFGLIKAFYVLILRILFLNNPIRESYYFFINRHKKSDLKITNFVNKTNNLSKDFSAKISVVIPTLNRYEYLEDVLSDLENQSYKNFDVWICDQTDDFNKEFYSNWNLDLHVIQQKEKALWFARNRCIKSSDGEYLLFFDDDSRVDCNWIQEHINVCVQYQTLISAGITKTVVGGGLSEKSNRIHLSDVLDTGNVLIHRSVFQKTGLFDENFEKMRMGDGEFGLRCLLSGHKIISNPYACRVHLKVSTGGLRQMGAWDAIHNIGLFKPKPIPSSLYFARKHFDKNTALIYGLTQLPKAFIPYSKKNANFKVKLFYYSWSFVFFPILLGNFLHSWRISTKMLERYNSSS